MPEVAYVLKGFPRLSELFVASEIHRLEEVGLPLRLYVLKAADEDLRHPLVDRIRAPRTYLPQTTSLSQTTLVRWLCENLSAFLPALARVARRRPLGLARAGAFAFAQSVRARRTFWSPPRKLFAKELLIGVALADALLEDPGVRHIHAHFAHGATTVAWIASMVTGLPFSFTGHAKDIYSPSLNPGGLLPRKLRAARFAVTCTEANREHLHELAPDAVVHRVYHGLNAELARLLERAAPARERAETFRILAVGRLVPKKGFDTLIEACGVLCAQGVPLDLRIVGESGEQEPELRSMIAASRLGDAVTLTGPMSQADLRREYERATCFCLPCRVLSNGDRDGIPNVLVEALACGLPVVTTGVSGIPELVEDRTSGLLVPADEAASLARALRLLYDDPGLARRLAENGREIVARRFDGDALARRLAELFREAVAA
ncbi:MAG TPA: glycosyltransferase family 4 protein [Gaiellaceae bacterium]|nr:glycosyltransferase family 4 protein [Gaiellaceae bacterium]